MSAVLFSISVLAATTGILQGMGLKTWQAWEVAGVLGGLALPLAFAGVFILLPATQTERRLATVGSAIGLAGVWLFKMNFPRQWYGDPVDNTFLVVGTYFIGVFMAFFALFVSVSNYEIPEREVIVKRIKTEVGATTDNGPPIDRIDSSQSRARDRQEDSQGGVGVFGDTGMEDEDVAAGEGGGEIIDGESRRETTAADRYCGNCDHFEYQRVGDSLQPVCTLADEPMDDLKACEEWQNNGSQQLETDGW